MANNPYVNKVQLADGTSLIDISDTTATASDVASGKYFYTATGAKEQGTASGGGSVTITDEPNATGTTCVITTGGSPTPPEPSGDIPLNTQLVDYNAVTIGVYVDEDNGTFVTGQSWDCITDYIKIDPSMSFSFVSRSWYGIGFYNSSKTPIRGYLANDLGTVSGEYVNGTITPSVIPSNAEYCVLTGNRYSLSANYLSLIRTA